MVSADVEILTRICSRVHRTIRRELTSPHRADLVAMGAYGTPTEALDRAAEGRLVEALEAEGVGWNVVSEEAGRIARGGDRTLVVDPVDGSHNALRGLGLSTISLALGNQDLDGVTVGMIHDLATGSTFWAEKGGGAFRDGRRIRTRSWDPRSEMFFINLGRHSTARATALASRGRRVRSLGCASLEIALVAQGGADAYFFDNENENGNLRVTDIAAGFRILAEAGGGLTDSHGGPLGGMPLAPGPRTSVFAWGDPEFARRAKDERYL
ncbi:MAG: inositol monophosphatase family protein [Thermoplasmata archaeon]